MKLLIVTQVIDTEHAILGFFHRWVIEFAQYYKHVHVIALQVGKYDLPDNVTVHSLGKEEGESRLRYMRRFYRYIWQLRHQYDAVFVHMNQIYVILGAAVWRFLRKRIVLWYMHGSVSMSLRIAEKLTHVICTGSPESCRLQSKKIVVTGHGIDTHRFTPQVIPEKNIDLITVGRITAAKNLTTLVDILSIIRASHDVSLTIVGVAVTKEEQCYLDTLQAHIRDKKLEKYIHIVGRVSQVELPLTLSRARIFVTVAQNGSLDKAVLEAMACKVPVVSMAPGTQSLALSHQCTNSDDVVSAIGTMLQSDTSSLADQGRALIIEKHSLEQLIPTINTAIAT